MNQTHYNSLINMYRSAPINKLFNPKLEVELGKSIITMNVNEKFDGLCLNKGINSFWGIELLPEIVTELIFIGNSCPNKER